MIDLRNGDCREVLRDLPDNSIDSVVTDPPYGLGFMGKKWDDEIACDVSLWKEVLRVMKPGAILLAFGGTRTYHRMVVAIEDAGFEIRDCIMWVYGTGMPKGLNIGKKVEGWDDWNTCLKPSVEPIVMARKPLDGTLIENVKKWGVGGINIGACRIGKETITTIGSANKGHNCYGEFKGIKPTVHQGRFPSNVILDESSAALLDKQSGVLKSGTVKGRFEGKPTGNIYGEKKHNIINPESVYGDKGGASRFFYCAKASKSERNGNTHVTVKPIKLMEYLVRLVTPPNGICLDPFMGSGTTGVACKGYSFFGIEKDSEYFEIAKERLG